MVSLPTPGRRGGMDHDPYPHVRRSRGALRPEGERGELPGKGEALVTHRVQFSCGCTSMRYEYEDGTVSEKVVTIAARCWWIRFWAPSRSCRGVFS